MTCDRIIGPYFYENETGGTVTATGAFYRKCIQVRLMPEINDINVNIYVVSTRWCNSTYKRESIQLLKTLFPNRLILRFGDVP